MPVLRLVVTFVHSLFKSRRQLVLENLALRQQVAMLRQSVLLCSTRSKIHKQPDALDEPVANHLPIPFHPIIGVEYVRFVG